MGNCVGKTIEIVDSLDLNDVKLLGDVVKRYYNVYDRLDPISKKKYDEAFDRIKCLI
jgi:hypothetical protein